MRIPAFLALVATLVLSPGSGLPVAAQQFRAENSGNANDESYTFVLKLGEEELQALRNGQSLEGKIPPEIRGIVTNVRLDYVPSGNAGLPATPPINFGGVSSGSRLGPELPASLNPDRYPGTGFLPTGGQPVSTQPGGSNNNLPATTNSFPAGNSNWNNPSNRNQSPPGNYAPNTNSSAIPPFVPPGRQENPGSRSLPPLAPQTVLPQTGNPNAGGGTWSPPTNATQGSYSPQNLPTPGNSIPQSGRQPNEVDTAISGSNNNWDPASAFNRFADSRFDGYRPPSPQPWETGLATDRSGPASNATPPVQRNGSLLAGYQFPAVPGQSSSNWNDPSIRQPGESPTDAELEYRARLAQLPDASQPANRMDPGVSVGMLRPGLGPVAATDSNLAQFNGFLYFMLLCSIGLNIYLGLISRGFYVRYRELADELRESFATV